MMVTGKDRREPHPDARRARVVQKVRTRFPRFKDFVTQYSTNMSMTGMFLRSDDPQPPGSQFEFEFSVSNEPPMIQGLGEVVWVREEAESDDRPVGMGVRFGELDPRSRRVIRWLMEAAIRDGHELFDLRDSGPDGDEDPSSEPRGALDSAARSRRSAAPADRAHVRSASSMRNQRVREKRRFRADLVALAVIALMVLVWWIVRWRGSGPIEEAASAPASEVRETAVTSVAPQEDPSATGAEDDRKVGEILREVRAWARAWTAREADEYLSFYGGGFEPPRGMGRREWETWRREQLAAPGFIRVALTGFEVEVLEEESATVSFFQSYRSDLLDETVRKRLVLALEDGSWKIIRERVEGS